MPAQRLLTVLTAIVLTLGGLSACGDKKTGEPIDSTFEESYEEMRETEEELAEDAKSEGKTPVESGAEGGTAE
ncbi:MAG: hypothetical protein U5K56_03850 [Halioglobus sp.]|nr:hypothetical protein [Halioglobus sp.]